MKLATFLLEKGNSKKQRFGALLNQGGILLELSLAARLLEGKAPKALSSALDLMDGGEKALDHARELLAKAEKNAPEEALFSPDEITLLAPVPRPRSIRDCMGFEEHVIQATQTVLSWRFPPLAMANDLARRVTGRPLVKPPRVWYEQPLFYTGNRFSVVGPGADVIWPAFTEKLDFELEFGVFIGKKGKNIAREKALDHVFGYTIFNDFSARDIQLTEMAGRLGPAKGKNFDTANAIGPYLVTADEVPDPYSLSMEARINGETWCKGTSAPMHHRFEDMIVHISWEETLHPGEFIGSGTVGGGCGLELDRWIAPNDVVELAVSGLGTLTNQVKRPPD